MSAALVEALEPELRTAMLAGDVETLDRLLADDLIFTSQEGATLGKVDDLNAHRSGALDITGLEPLNAEIRLCGSAAATVTRVRLAGRYDGHKFGGEFVYSRLWSRDSSGCRVRVAHCSQIK